MTQIIDSETEVRRNAYNAAFHELGLNWFWDAAFDVPCAAGERDCVRAYVTEHQSHLLNAYDADFLVDAILAAKERCAPRMTAPGCNPGATIDWRALRQHQVGV
jgi:hypothetical protein